MKHNYQLINAVAENPKNKIWKLDDNTLSLINGNFHYLNEIMNN